MSRRIKEKRNIRNDDTTYESDSKSECSSVISDLSDSSDSVSELFRYKVVYPGGTWVRSSPAANAEKTGNILAYGTIITASKSIVLDGVDYIQLADKSGWIFTKHKDTEILKLIDCVRGQANKFETEVQCDISSRNTGRFKNAPDISKSKASSKIDNLYWRDIRSQLTDVREFNDFCKLSNEIKMPNCIRFADGSNLIQNNDVDKLVCDMVMRIISITRQCSSKSVTEGLGPALWLLHRAGVDSTKFVQLLSSLMLFSI